jgi:Domain of unknown function (DUF4115)/O-Antigen ligase
MTAAVAAIRRRTPVPTWAIAALLAAISVFLGLLAGLLGGSGQTGVLFALVGIALVVVLWKKPVLCPIVVLLAALTVEQFPLTSGQPGATSTVATPSDYTDRIPLFHGLGGGLHVSPIDLLLVALLTIWVFKRFTADTASIPRSAVTLGIGATMVAALVGIGVGQAHGGELRTAFTEVRPYVYLSVAYLVASVFATRQQVIHVALWALVLGSGFKAAQALNSFLSVRSQIPRPDFVVGHEEALFFALFILVTALLWIFEVPGRLRTTATALFPLVLVADLVNSRRAAWLILGGTMIALTIITMVAVPARRRFMARLLAVLAIFSVAYFPTYWDNTGALAGPARALKSAVAPNTRDESSDLYRVQENRNLLLNIEQGGVLGRGFGLPIDYALPITDISSIDPLIRYIPHNGVFYIFMRMGLFGAIAFWSLIGAGIIAGLRLVRSQNREFAVFGALLSCALVGYALEGYNDQGFFMYRIALVMGTLLGLGEAARRLEARGAVAETAVPVPRPVRARTAPPVPRPVPAPALAAEPVSVPQDLGRYDRLAQRAALVLLPIAIGFFAWLALNGSSAEKLAPARPAPRVVAPEPRLTTPEKTSVTPAVAPVRTVELGLAAVRSDSWVEVRRGSRDGPIVFSGVIRQGNEIELSATRLWVRFGAASHLDITVNGRPVSLQGTVETIFTPKGPSNDQ